MKSKFIAGIGRLSLGAFIVLALSFNSYAASCNKRAAVHQSRAQNIQMQVQMLGYIPTTEEEEFVVCMLEEKEDKDAFRQRVQGLRNQQRAAQEREAAQRRQAAIEAARPASPAEQQRHKAICDAVNHWPQGSDNRASFQQYCMSLWAAEPHSSCTPSMFGDNLPCEHRCFDPKTEVCQNGRIVNRPKQNEEGRRADIRKPRLIIAPVGQWSDGFHTAEYSCWSATGEVSMTNFSESIDVQIERVGWSGKPEWMDRKHDDEHRTGLRFRSKTGEPISLIVMSSAGLGDKPCLMDDDLRAAYKAR